MENRSVIALLLRIIELLVELRNANARPLQPLDYPDPFEGLINNLEVMEILKISPSTLYRNTKKGMIKARRMGGLSYYDRKEIEKLIPFFLK